MRVFRARPLANFAARATAALAVSFGLFWLAGVLRADPFMVLDGTSFNNKPADLDARGFHPIGMVYESGLDWPSGVRDMPSQQSVANVALSFRSRGLQMVDFDFETWPYWQGGSFYQTDSNCLVTANKLITIANWVKAVYPGVSLAFYNYTPQQHIYATTDPNQVGGWRTHNLQFFQSVADVCDRMAPQLYTFGYDTNLWRADAGVEIALAREMAKGKLVTPYVWMHFHGGADSNLWGVLVPPAFFKRQLEIIHEQGASGVLIWDGDHTNWDENAPWWVATKEFLATNPQIVTPIPPAAAPSGLALTVASPTQINLAWQDNCGNETGFNIRWCTDGASFDHLLTIGANLTTYSHTGLTPGLTYTYKISATNGISESVYSSPASAALPGPPSAGRQLWLRADAGVTTDGSDNVSAWADQSGKGNTVAASVAAMPKLVANALNGGSVVRFDGLNNYLSATKTISSATNATIFIVFKAFKSGAAMKVFDNQYASAGTRRNVTLDPTGSLGGLGASVTNFNWAGQYLVVSAFHTGTNSALYFNGQFVTNTAGNGAANLMTPSASPIVVGASKNGPYSDKYAGDIAEIIVYDGVLSDAVRQSVESYLLARWLAPPPVVSQNPVGAAAACGGSAAFSISAAGVPPLGWQWYFNSNSIAGATNSTLTLSKVNLAHKGFYHALVTNVFGGAASVPVSLTITGPPPLITLSPLSVTPSCGAAASFTVAATGCNPITGYQWYLDANPILGANATTLTVTNANNSNAGAYRAVVFDAMGSSTSAPAYLSFTFTENFNSAVSVSTDGWQGYNTSANGNSFGFRNSNVSGGTNGAGEAGGTFARRSAIVYYGDTSLGSTFNLANVLHAEGELGTANYAGFNGDLLIGFFNTNSANQTSFANFAGFSFVDPGNGTVGNRIRALVYPAGGPGSASVPLDSGTVNAATYKFRLDYDPAGGVNHLGQLTVEFFNGSGSSIGATNCDLTAAQRAEGATFNAFGLVNGQNTDDATKKFDVYLDALTYTVAATCPGADFNRASCAFSNGLPVLRYTGTLNDTCTLQRTLTLLPPAWTNLASAVADGQGHVRFVDSNAPSTNAFYRVRRP